MHKKVVFDLGAHKGEDSDFYLRKGFRVVAVEASEKMCMEVKERMKAHPQQAEFTLLNYAVADKDNETITFYENSSSVWGTILESWDNRNKTFGTTSVKRSVKAITLSTLVNQELRNDEKLEYIKIDIEGADLLALRSFAALKQKPRFVSWESEKISWGSLIEEFDLLQKLGYSKFKIVDQSMVHRQQCKVATPGGSYTNYQFEEGCTGLFGDDLPGEWLTADEAIGLYRKIFVRYKYFGDYGIFNNKLVMKNRYLNKIMRTVKLRYPHVGWYDTHAAL
jgi:FkbM family methyltransferase